MKLRDLKAWPLYWRKVFTHRIPSDDGVGDTVARLVILHPGETFHGAFRRVFGIRCRCPALNQTVQISRADLNQRWNYGHQTTL